MSETIDPFLADMAVKKVELDGLDRKMEAAGVDNTWGNSVTSANYIDPAVGTKPSPVRGK